MLKVDNLHAYYGKSHVLHGVNFQVQAGEIVALLGRNGSGRSTTAKAVMGLVDCQGVIDWKGQNIQGKKAYEVAHLGIVAHQRRHARKTLCVLAAIEIGVFANQGRGDVTRAHEIEFQKDAPARFIARLAGFGASGEFALHRFGRTARRTRIVDRRGWRHVRQYERAYHLGMVRRISVSDDSAARRPEKNCRTHLESLQKAMQEFVHSPVETGRHGARQTGGRLVVADHAVAMPQCLGHAVEVAQGSERAVQQDDRRTTTLVSIMDLHAVDLDVARCRGTVSLLQDVELHPRRRRRREHR